MAFLIAGDTETTGLSSKAGDRIIELALVEITRNGNPRTYHETFDPEGREISPEAFQVHGISADMLIGKRTFAQALPDILAFVGDDPTLVFHNAPFDFEFIRDECDRAGSPWPEHPVIDTMVEAAREFPRGRHGLDALCNRFGIDLSKRVKHGALIDTQLLADLFLAWKGQSGLDLVSVQPKRAVASMEALGELNDVRVRVRPSIVDAPPAASWAKHFEGVVL